MKHIILDYGHGSNTPGKASPDRTFREYQFNRRLGHALRDRLRAHGYNVHETWTLDHEPLTDPANQNLTHKQINDALLYRVREANRIAAQYARTDTILLSLHANAAASDGTWHNARGFMAIVGTRASQASRRLARCIYDQADAAGLRGNRYVPAERYWTQALAICNQTACPAVLTESLFYDNRQDLAFLQTRQGIQTLADIHLKGIQKYLDNNPR